MDTTDKKTKIFRNSLLVALIIVLAACCLTGCNLIKGLLGSVTQKFALQETTVTVKVGEILEITRAANSIEESFTLKSDDETKVAVVDNVKIKGVAKTDSAVTVTATSSSGKTAEVSVSVAYADVGELSIATSGGSLIQLLSESESAEQINFTAVLNDGISPDTLISWKVTEFGGSTAIATGTGKTFAFTPLARDTLYSVSVAAGDKSDHVECGIYNRIYISSEKTSYKVGKEIVLSVMFREDEAIVGNTVSFNVFQNGTEKYHGVSAEYSGSGAIKQAEISLGNYTALGTYQIYVVYDGDESNVLTVLVADYAATDHITAAVDSSLLLQNGTAQTTTFTATVSPTNADVAGIHWYVNGVKDSATGQTFSYKPSLFGEYHVQAVSDDGKVKSPVQTIVYLPTTDTRNNYTDILTNYGGYPQNGYITSQEELNNAIVYALENQLYGSSANKLALYVDFSHTGTTSDVIDTARSATVESGLIAGYSYTESGKVVSIEFSYYPDGVKIVNTPSKDAGSDSTAQSSVSAPHYTYATHTRNFYIDTSTKTMSVSTSNMLYKAVAWGYKPEFSGTEENKQNLSAMYDNARTVLANICTDDMTETEKAHAIYDWIIYKVRYDYDLASLGGLLNDSMKNYGYYLEGIFLDQFFDYNNSHAVCDGKSKAFVLLCGIEGIDALRIGGNAKTDGGTGGHAWNKILLDPDDDGDKNWYLVDTTWGDRSVTVSGETTEYLTHGYFLINDKTAKTTHFEDSDKNYPVADGVYDYYANIYFTYSGVTYDFVIGGINKNTELNYLFRWVKAQGLKYVEFEYDGTLADSTVSTAAASSGLTTKFSSPIEVRSGVYAVVFN